MWVLYTNYLFKKKAYRTHVHQESQCASALHWGIKEQHNMTYTTWFWQLLQSVIIQQVYN